MLAAFSACADLSLSPMFISATIRIIAYLPCSMLFNTFDGISKAKYTGQKGSCTQRAFRHGHEEGTQRHQLQFRAMRNASRPMHTKRSVRHDPDSCHPGYDTCTCPTQIVLHDRTSYLECYHVRHALSTAMMTHPPTLPCARALNIFHTPPFSLRAWTNRNRKL